MITKQDFEWHLKGETDCLIRGDLLGILVRLQITSIKIQRENFMIMLMHCAQMEQYNWQVAHSGESDG